MRCCHGKTDGASPERRLDGGMVTSIGVLDQASGDKTIDNRLAVMMGGTVKLLQHGPAFPKIEP